MKRFLISVFLTAAFGFGVASPAQAQIVYGYSTPNSDYGGSGKKSSSQNQQYNWQYFDPATNEPIYLYPPVLYPPGSYSQSSGSGGGGGGYSSPVTAYLPVYPPMGPNYRLSPVSNYGSSLYGTGTGFNMTPFGMSGYGGMSTTWSPLWMNSRFGGTMGPMWMRRR